MFPNRNAREFWAGPIRIQLRLSYAMYTLVPIVLEEAIIIVSFQTGLCSQTTKNLYLRLSQRATLYLVPVLVPHLGQRMVE
jgi:hypothetical protein